MEKAIDILICMRILTRMTLKVDTQSTEVVAMGKRISDWFDDHFIVETLAIVAAASIVALSPIMLSLMFGGK